MKAPSKDALAEVAFLTGLALKALIKRAGGEVTIRREEFEAADQSELEANEDWEGTVRLSVHTLLS